MKLYLDNGYVNMRALIEHEAPFVFCYGGRGTGKTYGTLGYCRKEEKQFMLMRRTAVQVDMLKRDDLQPFKILNKDNGWSIQSFPINQYLSAFYESELNDKGKLIPTGDRYGLLAALSTFSNLRGIDAQDIEILVLDEFIPEENERPIKGEANAVFNAYETINRNRELSGRKPLKLICLANSNRIDNPIFMELKLVTLAQKLRASGREYYYDPKRKILLVDLFKSKISEEKAETALYQLTRGTEFYDMAIKNRFTNEQPSRVGSRNIKEYKAVVSVGEITIYKHKSKREYYCTKFKSGSPETFTTGDKDLLRFQRHYLHLWQAYMRNSIVFEEYICEILFDRYFNK